MCVLKIKKFHNSKDSMDNTEINTGLPLRIKKLCNEEQSDRLVIDKRFLK